MIKLLVFVLCVYICVGAFLFLIQRTFIYYPTPEFKHSYTEEHFEFDKATVKVLALNQNKERAIVYFGGNAEAVERTAPELKNLFPECAVYLVKYRGYGGSTGKPSEQGLYSDALRIIDTLIERHAKVSVIGRSLGSGVATYVAANRAVEKLVLVTPYDSIQSIAQKSYPMYPMSFMLKDKYDSVGRANKITAETLILLAENDTVISRPHSDKLIAAMQQQAVDKIVVSNSGHNTISETKQYRDSLHQFMNCTV